MGIIARVIVSVFGFVYRALAVDVIATATLIIARIIATLLTRGVTIARCGAVLELIRRRMPKQLDQRAASLVNSTIDSAFSKARITPSVNYETPGFWNSIGTGNANISIKYSIGNVQRVVNKNLSLTSNTSPFVKDPMHTNGLGSWVAQGSTKTMRINEFNTNGFLDDAKVINAIRTGIKRDLHVYWYVEAKKLVTKELEALIGKFTLAAILGYITQLENLNADDNVTTPIELAGYSEPFKIKLKIELKAKLKAKSDKYVTNQKWFSSNGTCSGGLNNYCNTQSPPNSYGTCVETEKKKKWERKSGSTNTFSLDDQDAEFYVSKISVQHGSGIDSGLRSSINTWAAGLANNHSKLINAINNTDPAINPNPKWSSVSGVLAKINNEFSSWLKFLNAISIVKSLGATLVGVGGCFLYDARQHASSYLNKITCSSITPPRQDPYGALCSWTRFSQTSKNSFEEAKQIELKEKTISFNAFVGWAEYNTSVSVASFEFYKQEDPLDLYPKDPGVL